MEINDDAAVRRRGIERVWAKLTSTPRNAALSSPRDFDVPGEGSSGERCKFLGAYNTRERAIDAAKFTLF